MNLAIPIAQAAGVLCSSCVEARLDLDVTEAGINNILAVVEIDFALPQYRVADTNPEDMLDGPVTFRQIGIFVRAHQEAQNRTIDDEIGEIPLMLKDRNDARSNRNTVDLEQRRSLVRRGTAHDDVI